MCLLASLALSLGGCEGKDYKVNFLYYSLLGKAVYFPENEDGHRPPLVVRIEHLRTYGLDVLGERTDPLPDGRIAHQVDLRFFCQLEPKRFVGVLGTIYFIKDPRDPWNVEFRGFEQTGHRLAGNWTRPLPPPWSRVP
ncbi:MAG: hypothetical protein ACFB20_02910 [Opitutales bacterium]